MSKMQINEEMGVHKEWYEQAKEQTTETLPEFIRHLTEDYEHDYGTICHALAAGGIATMWAMNETSQGGITGFQAGAIMWEFIRHWNYNHNKAGMKIIDYDNLLYPQYDYKFDKSMSETTWDIIQKEASEKLKEKDYPVHPDVKAHWESIVEGKIPFGFKINEEEL